MLTLDSRLCCVKKWQLLRAVISDLACSSVSHVQDCNSSVDEENQVNKDP